MIDSTRWTFAACLLSLWALTSDAKAQGPQVAPPISGIYPHLAMFNDEGECGTGAVVPFGGKLWVITYGPHLPLRSSDKLYEVTPELQQIVRPESVGGTNANRMIHAATNQLVIGSHVIASDGQVRTIPRNKMPGRLTGNATHLSSPQTKIYFATMEEGLYEVDLKTLDINCLIRDGNKFKPEQLAVDLSKAVSSKLPGYHGKGLFTSQGIVVYANNGDHDPRVVKDPTVPSGALGYFGGVAGTDWQLIRRNQFTEVTGPSGVVSNDPNSTQPIWSLGWDAKSLLLMVCEKSQWHTYRLPKASHSYDGAHGWNTEWPRIRDIGEESLLATMHGTFWKFPKTFSPGNSAGIAPRSNYLKVVGDFCQWNDKIVLGCDDTAKSEFLNKRKAKGEIAGPGQSHSNLWFLDREQLDQLGPVIGRGSVWLNESVVANQPSDPYLIDGFTHRQLVIHSPQPLQANIRLEVDKAGTGEWTTYKTLTSNGRSTIWESLPRDLQGVWMRLVSDQPIENVTATFGSSNPPAESRKNVSDLAQGLSLAGSEKRSGGVIHSRGGNFRSLRYVARTSNGQTGCYDLTTNLKTGALTLAKVDDADGMAWTSKNVAIPQNVISRDEASIVYEDASGRWRLPVGDWQAPLASGSYGPQRVCREVCTERDLFHAGQTFFELPAENASGMAKIRPVTTHPYSIDDYASHRGLLVLSGVADDAAAGSHVARSTDGACALWVGAVDDLWSLGQPKGSGGPWKNTLVKANVPSDPYLLTGYRHRRIELSHDQAEAVNVTLEIDVTGTGLWTEWKTMAVPAGKAVEEQIPDDTVGYWIRARSSQNGKFTTWLVYGE